MKMFVTAFISIFFLCSIPVRAQSEPSIVVYEAQFKSYKRIVQQILSDTEACSVFTEKQQDCNVQLQATVLECQHAVLGHSLQLRREQRSTHATERTLNLLGLGFAEINTLIESIDAYLDTRESIFLGTAKIQAKMLDIIETKLTDWNAVAVR